LTAAPITVERVAQTLAPRLPMYRWRKPTYQAVMLQALQRLWAPGHHRVLDIGGGTGVIAQAVQDLLPVEQVVSVDIEDRYADELSIETATYDGVRLPFEDGAFDAVMFNNVLHHVPVRGRLPLMLECRRVAPAAPVYIKDHLAASGLDHRRLAVLDWLGNVPFDGMVKAEYLEMHDWEALAAAAGYAIEARESADYRAGPFAALFPNRLEIAMRWRPLSG
jgi:SAM-dependent methyltransferase